MKTTTRLMLALTLLTVPVVYGCSSAPTRLETTYGNAARQMVSQQIADVEAVNRPITARSLDGPYGEEVLGNYRIDIAKPKEVSNDIVFNIGR